MRKTRYILEKVPRGQLGEIAKTPGEWHGVWLDDDTLMAVADLEIHEIDRLSSHPDCFVFASLQDTTPMIQQLQKFDDKQQVNGRPKAKLAKAGVSDFLDKHGVLATDTLGQAALKIASVHKHPYLEP
jgi:hypothetical protein